MDKAAEILKNDSLRKAMEKAGELMKKARGSHAGSE
jgi:hypothetical protein